LYKGRICSRIFKKPIGLKDAVIQYGPGGSEELPFQLQAPRANHMATSTICGFVEAPCSSGVEKNWLILAPQTTSQHQHLKIDLKSFL
jgi:hypothetical protein